MLKEIMNCESWHSIRFKKKCDTWKSKMGEGIGMFFKDWEKFVIYWLQLQLQLYSVKIQFCEVDFSNSQNCYY